MTASPVRVLLADDHPIVRAGLAQVLGTFVGIDLVGAAGSGEEAVWLNSRHHPDLIIMDVRMPGLGGVGATLAIRSASPLVRIIGLPTEPDPSLVSQMLQAGASGFLVKTCSAAELEAAIHAVVAGQTVLDPEIADQAAARPPTANLDFGIQQRRVLNLLVKGFTNPEIAEMVGISLPTARYHVSAILIKLGASNRAEAAALAISQRLVDVGA